MSAAEDYPDLANWAWYKTRKGTPAEARKVLLEVDMLRADVSKLLSMLSAAGVEWPSP
jgi:hypothetical protein